MIFKKGIALNIMLKQLAKKIHNNNKEVTLLFRGMILFGLLGIVPDIVQLCGLLFFTG